MVRGLLLLLLLLQVSLLITRTSAIALQKDGRQLSDDLGKINRPSQKPVCSSNCLCWCPDGGPGGNGPFVVKPNEPDPLTELLAKQNTLT